MSTSRQRSVGDAHAYAELIGRALLETDLAGIVVLDARWRVLEVTAAAEELFGRRRDEVLGQPFDALIVSAMLRRPCARARRRPLEVDPMLFGIRTEQTAVGGDGSHFPVELTLLQLGCEEDPTFVAFVRHPPDRRPAGDGEAADHSLLAEAEELAGAGSFERDLRSGALVWSDGIHRLLGLATATRPTPEHAAKLIHPADRVRLGKLLETVLRERRPNLSAHVRITRPDGVERTVELRAKVVLDDFGEPARLVGAARDVTEELEARRARDLLAYVVDSSDDAILTTTPRGIITSWNRGAERLYGWTAEEAIGRPITLITPVELEREQVELTNRVFAGESIHRLEVTRARKDGSEVFVSLSAAPVCDSSGRTVSASLTARDVTERRLYEERLQYLAEHDHLTGLLNRRRFEEELRRELHRASRSGQGGAVLSLDLDGFKELNDTAGHAAGDLLLREVGTVLLRHVRASDVLARLGGDEFGVLLPDTDAASARAAAHNLLDALHGCTVSVEGTPFRVNASIGVALFEGGSEQADEMMVSADLAMYTAKQQGRDRIAVFSLDEARTVRADARLSWGQRIRFALETDGLVLHWQPIADARSGQPTHGELLLRMSSGGKLLTPGEFLAPAERLGLIHAIDRWVISRAIELLGRGESPGQLPLSVNLSGESVAGDPDLLGLVEREVKAAGADPSQLIFEVTETAAIANIAEARAFAQGAQRLGCRLALDDFGTGFGSFYHLKHLPVDFIKIDREFVHNLPSSQVDQRLVRSIVDVARSLGIRTVAESVGDDATITALRGIGVDYLQGFHVGRPVPLGDAAR